MATKKKAAVKKATKTTPPRPVLEIFILPDNSIYPPGPVYVDGKGKRHSKKVVWQAVDVTKKYQIVLATPPRPFKNGYGPFPTDADGRTKPLRVDKKCPNSANKQEPYRYSVEKLNARLEWVIMSGGGIIVDS